MHNFVYERAATLSQTQKTKSILSFALNRERAFFIKSKERLRTLVSSSAPMRIVLYLHRPFYWNQGLAFLILSDQTKKRMEKRAVCAPMGLHPTILCRL
jgi:hypothetical protein